MVYHVDDSNFFEYIVKHKRIVWFFFRKGQETSSLSLKPFIEEIPSVNSELAFQYKEVTFFQTIIEDSPKLMEYFNLMDDNIWDFRRKIFNPRIVTVKNGAKHYDQSGNKCYCLETVIEMMFDLYPELVPEPSSE